MGLIIDTSVLISAERRGETLDHILTKIRIAFPLMEIGISAIAMVEFDHGLARARSDSERTKRHVFAEGIASGLVCYPVDQTIARIAGRIEGELASQGFSIGLADLLIGCTALHLGDSVLTANPRHFALIPSLSVLTL